MMKHRTFALFLALGLSLSLLSGCGPKESGSTSQPGGSTSSSQGSPDASQPDISLPDASAPDTSAPGESAPEAPQPPVDEPEAVAALALDKSDFSLFKAGSSYQLKATVSGVDAPKVTWTSSDETVAAVSQDGTVTAVARGTATITAAVEAITGALIEGEKVQLVGFGSFEVKTRAARVGRNPKTGEEIPISEARLPVFKAGKALKDAVAK